MNSSQLIDVLKSATIKDLLYSIKEFNITESQLQTKVLNKNISCSFLASFKHEQSEVTLCQGISVDYYSSDTFSYQRKELERVDYVDSILFKGVEDIQSERLDLVFLSTQLDQPGITATSDTINKLIDIMFDKADVNKNNINSMLMRSFDKKILDMFDVEKIVSEGSKGRLLEELSNIKMSQLEGSLPKTTYAVENIKVEEDTNAYILLSGTVLCTLIFKEITITTKYYLLRKYPKHTPAERRVCINNSNIDVFKFIGFDNRNGEILLDLNDREKSMLMLENNSSLFFKMQSIFSFIKRKHNSPKVIQYFDAFFDAL